MSKERNWFEMNGWHYDMKNHCWIKESGEKDTLHETLELKGSKKANLGMEVIEGKNRSKPFSTPFFYKIRNIIIFNSPPYPLRWHEVMFKK